MRVKTQAGGLPLRAETDLLLFPELRLEYDEGDGLADAAFAPSLDLFATAHREGLKLLVEAVATDDGFDIPGPQGCITAEVSQASTTAGDRHAITVCAWLYGVRNSTVMRQWPCAAHRSPWAAGNSPARPARSAAWAPGC